MPKENSHFQNVFFRLQGLGVKNQTHLSQILGISPGGVSDAKKKGKFPAGWALKLSGLYGKSVEWILGRQEFPPEQTEINLVKSLVADIAELKNQLIYMESTISLLREEMDIVKAERPLLTAKKNGQDYSDQLEEEELTPVGGIG